VTVAIPSQHPVLVLEELRNRFWGPGENDFIVFLNKRTLDKIWMLDKNIQ
jgi:hypothetical protein